VSPLDVSRAGAVATVTLDRPDRLNALDPSLLDALTEGFTSLAGDADVRVIVLQGAGSAFCAGADIEHMAASAELAFEDNVRDAERMASTFEAVDATPKPVVARVHGYAFGGGAGLVACADWAVAAAGTTFAFSEVRLGLLPATISPYVLRSIGLVHEVVADDQLDARVQAAVGGFLDVGPEAVASCKRLVRETTASLSLDDLPERIALARTGAEGREGVAAFLERRSPSWSDGS
jgi:methylglutaconyl-CoA hydratase